MLFLLKLWCYSLKIIVRKLFVFANPHRKQLSYNGVIFNLPLEVTHELYFSLLWYHDFHFLCFGFKLAPALHLNKLIPSVMQADVIIWSSC
ncbi:hypothetical protein QVD17_03612 [Tagetes erecta]|uniref:Uncharacterized protein n=1 Tax=Tagetes erecta TaxID=13708 RepID=A0AAD8LBM0_TARER|nr:hypothetical protein QVD17_03612 [Tagetes erecta]